MIGFYVHHHGRGHIARTQAVLAHLGEDAAVLTSAEVDPAELPGADLVRLPSDVDAGPAGPTPPTLHYAPLGGTGLRQRMARLAGWVEHARPSLLVVDVSVEVAVFARLLGVPVAVVRQHGDRRDAPHRLAYDTATALLAPFPAELEDPSAGADVRERTRYCGLYSRFDGRELSREAARVELGIAADERVVVVLSGAGGAGADLSAVRAAASTTPGWRWIALGVAADDPLAAGWVPDPYPHLRAADVVVAAAGHNAVAEVLAADRPLVCIPEERPFGEQHAKAAALERVGAALVRGRWPAPGEWPALLAAAADLDPAVRRRLADGGGARRAAAHLEEIGGRPASAALVLPDLAGTG